MKNPERGEDVTVSLLEEQRHSVATNQRDSVLALGDRHVTLLGEDVLQIRLDRVARMGKTGVCSVTSVFCPLREAGWSQSAVDPRGEVRVNKKNIVSFARATLSRRPDFDFFYTVCVLPKESATSRS